MTIDYKIISKNLKFEGRAFIYSNYVDVIGGEKFENINPVTCETLCSVAKCNHKEVEFGVDLSRKDFDTLKQRLKDNGTKYYDEPYLRFKGNKYE